MYQNATVTRRCPHCGSESAPNAPPGACTRCALEQALAASRAEQDTDKFFLHDVPLPTRGPPSPAGSSPRDPVTPAAITGLADSNPSMEKPGDRIGNYRLVKKIGEGGCGVVYLAEQEEPVRRRVALKIIKLGMDTHQVIGRFEAERQVLALLDHPNIAKVLEAGATEAGRPFFVMELVNGIPITRYCDQRNLSTKARLQILVQVCHAIQHAHQKGIIHRDIKPSNILVADHEGMAVPKVIDFGIAKATNDQRLTDKTVFTAFEQFIGTPAYMSPEQAGMGGVDIDTRSDIYSLGVLLYELLTGQTPFEARRLASAGLYEIQRIIREEEPHRPSTRLSALDGAGQASAARHRHTEPPKLLHQVRGDLDWIAMKTLDKERNRRYETANGLAMDIQRHLDNEPVIARPPSRLYLLQKMVRRNQLAVAAGVAVAASLVIGSGLSTWQYVEKSKAEREQSRLRVHEVQLRQQAEASAAETKMTLSWSDFVQANRLIAAGEGRDALAYLARSLFVNPSNEAASIRLATLLTSRSWWLPTVVLKHTARVNAAQFSPDGKRLLTASDDHTARVWDAQTGLPLTEPLDHGGGMTAQFSLDGQRMVTASDDSSARVWDARSGKLLFEPLKHSDRVWSAQFSPDGRRIVTASIDHTARVWDAQTGLPLTPPLNHAERVWSAQFSPDGQRVVTAAFDHTACVWDAQTGRRLLELKPGGWVKSAQFSPDGKRIVTSSEDNMARVWDAVASSELNTARVWDAQTGQPLTEPLKHDDRMSSAEFSPDGKRIVTASFDHTARLWDAQTGRLLAEPFAHHGTVKSAVFSPDGRRIATASEDGTARVWEAQSAPPLLALLKHADKVVSAQFSPDGRRVVTASYDHTARVWDAETGAPLTEPLNHDDLVWAAQFSPDGKRVATASFDHTARIWDALTGRPLTGPLLHGDKVMWVQFSPDGQRLVTVSGDPLPSIHGAPDGAIRVWDARTGQPLTDPWKHKRTTDSTAYPAEGNERVYCARFSPDGKRLVTACDDGTAREWDPQTGLPLAEPMRHHNTVYSALFSPDGQRIATTSWDHTARVWDAQTGRPLFESIKNNTSVNNVQFSPDGKWLLTSGDKTARLWDAQTGQPLTEALVHNDSVTSAQFSPDGKRVVTASADGTARIWDAQSGQPLTAPLSHNGPVRSAQFSPDGRRVVTASADNTARVWDIAPVQNTYPAWLLELSEAISGQVLNQQNVLEETRLNRAETINRIREKLNHETNGEDWVVWGRWFLAAPSSRTISPFSKTTVPEYIQRGLPYPAAP